MLGELSPPLVRSTSSHISSLDDICRKNGAIPINVVGKVAEAVLRGLMYLYDVHRIIHRGELPLLHNMEGTLTGQISNPQIFSQIPRAKSKSATLASLAN